MAEKKAPEERIYTIPLRGGWIKTRRINRAGHAARSVKSYLSRHMKEDNVKISERLNQKIWSSGLKKPPGKVRVKISKDNEGAVVAMLPDEKIEVIEEKKKGTMERLRGMVEDKGKGASKEEAKGPKTVIRQEKSSENKETVKETVADKGASAAKEEQKETKPPSKDVKKDHSSDK